MAFIIEPVRLKFRKIFFVVKDIFNIGDNGSLLTEARKTKCKPNKYNVILVNDERTPMDFIVDVLQECFNKDHNESIRMMLEVYNKGSAVCGTYTKEIAETKSTLVSQYSEKANYSLKCCIEKLDS